MGKNLSQRVQGQMQSQQSNDGSLESKIKAMEEQFVMALPKSGPDATQLVRDSLTLLRQNPKLAECEPLSFLGSLMTCAQLGLRPGIGALGEAWVLPMWNGRDKRFDATFIIGYPGMLMLANRSGEIDHVTANAVKAKDHFHADFATGTIEHPVTFGDRGETIGYYATFTRKGSDRPAASEFMSLEEMQAHRDKFAMAKKKDGTVVGPWASDFDAMARKTMIRQLFKWMPRTTEIQNALVADNTVRLDTAPTADLTEVSEQSRDAAPVEGSIMDNSRGIPSGDVDPETGEVPDGWGQPTGQEAGA